jgi:hypothetical protein
MSEKREFIRVPMNFRMLVRKDDNEHLSGNSQDISLRGAYLNCPGNYELGDECEMTIELGEGENQVSIEMIARVVRVDDQGIGVEFVGIKGIAALDHLRNLVLYNAEDKDAITEEINDHVGIKRKKTTT